MWFQSLTGFPEESPDQVRSRIAVDGIRITSRETGREMTCGHLETPSLGELRSQLNENADGRQGSLALSELIADAQSPHTDPENTGTTFQISSQFNHLEMRKDHALAEISERLSSATDEERDKIRQVLRIGIQSGTEGTLGDSSHIVTQTYCSALPVAYSPHSVDQWAAFAKLVRPTTPPQPREIHRPDQFS